jgi:hypothetical protein
LYNARKISKITFSWLRSYSSLISLAIGPVITIETVLLAIAKLAKPTKVPIPS